MFSMITVPSSGLTCSTHGRARVSNAPPGGNGTTSRIGRVGYACAQAMRETAGSAAAPAARCKNLRRGSFILNPPSRFTSLDHLVGAGEQRRWHVEAERPRSVEVDHQLELRRLHNRQVHGLGAL